MIGKPNYKDFTIKTQVGYNYLLAADDSHMDTLDALTHKQRSVQDIYPQNVTGRIIHLAYKSQPNAKSSPLQDCDPIPPQEASLNVGTFGRHCIPNPKRNNG